MSKKKSILVTGGAGSIGSSLCERLLKKGHKVVCLDNFNTYYAPAIKRRNIQPLLKNKNFTLIKGDILNQKKLKEVFTKYSCATVIHLAAQAGVRPSIKDPYGYAQTNVLGAVNVLEQCQRNKIKNFILASSSSVYGNNPKTPFSESHRVDNPISPYAATKKAAELMAHSYHAIYGMNIAVLRFFTVYGPKNRPDMAHFLITKALMENRPVIKYGNGQTSRDYTYIDDIVDGIIACLNKKFGYKIINLGNSRTISLNQMIGALEKATVKKAKVIQKPLQPGDVLKTCADISQAKKLLNWKPKTPYEAGVKKMVEWYKKTYGERIKKGA